MNRLKPSRLTIEQWLHEYAYELPKSPPWSLIDHAALIFLCKTEGDEVQIIEDEERLNRLKIISSHTYFIAPLDMFLMGESEYTISPPSTARLYRLRIIPMLRYCLLTDLDDPNEDKIVIDGITAIFNFSMKRITEMRQLILSFIKELPLNFEEGASYHMMHTSKWEEELPWTDKDLDCEALLVLGLAIGAMKFSHSRELWPTLPDGVPWVKFI